MAGLKFEGLDNSMNVFGNSITLLSKQDSVNLSFVRTVHPSSSVYTKILVEFNRLPASQMNRPHYV